VPAGQETGLPLGAGQYCPASAEQLPPTVTPQATDPTDAVVLPAGQAVHEVAPAAAWENPTPQEMQAADPKTSL
jgi:hypothetical protein